MAEDRINALVDAMTVEEKIALLAGKDAWTTVPIPRLGIPSIKVSDGPNGARGGGAFIGGVAAAALSGRDFAVFELGRRSGRRNRRGARRRGAVEGRARAAGADGQHASLDAERPQLRVLFGRPAF